MYEFVIPEQSRLRKRFIVTMAPTFKLNGLIPSPRRLSPRKLRHLFTDKDDLKASLSSKRVLDLNDSLTDIDPCNGSISSNISAPESLRDRELQQSVSPQIADEGKGQLSNKMNQTQSTAFPRPKGGIPRSASMCHGGSISKNKVRPSVERHHSVSNMKCRESKSLEESLMEYEKIVNDLPEQHVDVRNRVSGRAHRSASMSHAPSSPIDRQRPTLAKHASMNNVGGMGTKSLQFYFDEYDKIMADFPDSKEGLEGGHDSSTSLTGW